MKELLKKISDELVEKKAKEPHFDNKDYMPKLISTTNFKTIVGSSIKDMGFIDGGNIEVVGNNNFSLQLMKIYWTIYKNNKRVENKISNYLVFISIRKQGSSLDYICEIYSDYKLINTITYDLTRNNERIKPESIINSVRKIYEIKAIIELADILDPGNIIVMDGNLAVKNTLEYKAIKNAYEKIIEKKIILTGICKTSSIITDTGANLTGYIHNISPPGKWYYHPICINNNQMHDAEMTIAKLHEKSQFTFVVDIYSKNKESINDILYSLSMNSKDPVFLGYPYGLIESDRLARCQENEKQCLKSRCMQILGTEKIRQVLNTNKAHDILDNIN